MRHTVDDPHRANVRERIKNEDQADQYLTLSDQDKALRFYTETLGFTKKTDISNGPYRWLTVASAEEQRATELPLALNDNPAAKAYQEAMFEQGQPAAIFHTDDLQRDYDRLTGEGVTFTTPLAKEAWGFMAVLDDTCGNLIQLTQLSCRLNGHEQHQHAETDNASDGDFSAGGAIDDREDRRVLDLHRAHRLLSLPGGLAYLLAVPDVVEGVIQLGFPLYFIQMLGVWKALGEPRGRGARFAAPQGVGLRRYAVRPHWSGRRVRRDGRRDRGRVVARACAALCRGDRGRLLGASAAQPPLSGLRVH